MEGHREVVCVGGPTGAGKDTVVTEFLKRREGYVRVPRCTTRKPRPYEVDGVHYHFLSREEFEAGVERLHICAIDDFCGARYGIDVREIIKAHTARRRVIGVFGICSLRLRGLFDGQTSLVYVSAPIPVLRERLIRRGHLEKEVARRLEAAKQQLAEEPMRFDHVIVNDGTVAEAVNRLVGVIDGRKVVLPAR